jgi:YbbR domain-containing protein
MKNLNKRTSSKTFNIVISLTIAVLLWFYVVNYENNDMTSTISGIPISYIGADDILEDRHLLVSDSGGKVAETVSVTVYGKRSIVSSRSRQSFTASVDLTSITSTGTIKLPCSVDFVKNLNTEGVYIIRRSPELVEVTIDKMTSKTVEVREDFKGSVAEGYMREPIIFKPETVTVSGPEEIVSGLPAP